MVTSVVSVCVTTLPLSRSTPRGQPLRWRQRPRGTAPHAAAVLRALDPNAGRIADALAVSVQHPPQPEGRKDTRQPEHQSRHSQCTDSLRRGRWSLDRLLRRDNRCRWTRRLLGGMAIRLRSLDSAVLHVQWVRALRDPGIRRSEQQLRRLVLTPSHAVAGNRACPPTVASKRRPLLRKR